MDKTIAILVTGANGFIGKNLIVELKNQGYQNILPYDLNTPQDKLDEFAQKAQFVFHLAGVNRPQNPEEFMLGNFGFTSQLLDLLTKHNNKAPIMLASSIQAVLDNPYGQSKKAGEELLFRYGQENNVNVLIYRFTNVFGKWCRPNYNSAVATFCHNIARDLPITVNDPNVMMNLIYIDDVVEELIHTLEGQGNKVGKYYEVPVSHKIKLGEIVDLLKSFKESRESLGLPNFADPLHKKLYSTYLSYLPEDQFGYELRMIVDQRGSFTEFVKSDDRGQVSINVAKPGITKGNHWHHTKCEKFLVVSGEGIIRFRRIDTDQIHEYQVSGDKLTVIDIPVGYTHNIQNIGTSDLVTVMWANELLDKNKPDTYFLEV